ncbi:hypothetical protein AM501_18020 [Aneurinibacillus migulanus]|uniref:hypothetical protein n=1 Tax=Aneurinibacillus migulanus TaxID=47500 RepID=UPI0005BDEC37|nr:hypothetical protein [Aneurinibacillus migulanus]KIV56315.1 hypothetical protein TS64_09700 [Aneurinibacillus migulanus]KPD06977.1 hypothetical protein AM501_18020 [Aneurinibacillus migulanus]CEH29132.1 Uncharacterized protein BN1090_A2_01558 [Aneurinibacillus migulanus]
MREYLLYCIYCNEYTSLGKHVEKEGHFEGEYSLLYNQRINNDDILCRFLIRHVGHDLRMYYSPTDDYSDVLKKADRFMDANIDTIVELTVDREAQKVNEIQMERGLGQLQLNVLNKLLDEAVNIISKLPTNTSAEAQFLLGKEEGLKQAQAILKDLMDKTNTLYK